MPLLPAPHRHRLLRLLIASAAFLLGSSVLLVVLIRGYLRPAYQAWQQADPQQRSLLSASSTLLLAVVLVVLLLLLITAIGVRRFFQHHRAGSERHTTPYIDAWAESARRMPLDPDSPSREKDAS